MKKYYIVQAKCGHVGRGKYTVKSFTVTAYDSNEAKEIVRWIPRVLHHHKNAIENVLEVSIEEYKIQCKTNREDLYFKCRSIQEQRESELELELFDKYEVVDKELRKEKRVARINYKKMKEATILNSFKNKGGNLYV